MVNVPASFADWGIADTGRGHEARFLTVDAKLVVYPACADEGSVISISRDIAPREAGLVDPHSLIFGLRSQKCPKSVKSPVPAKPKIQL